MNANYKAVRINDITVKKVPLSNEEDTRPIRGCDLFPEIYSNVFLCAKKKSGKSSTIYKIVKDCVGKNTKIIAFVSTLYKDSTWKSIREFCKGKRLDFEGHTSLMEDGRDQLSELVERLQEEAKDQDEEEELDIRVSNLEKKLGLKCPLQLDGDSESEEDEKPRKKEKYRAPEYIIVLDDLSNELKSRSLVSLLKKNRHFKAKILVSSQYLNDLLPESRKQIDVFLVFRGQPEKKLKEIYADADVNVDRDEFYDIYKFATEKEFSFLYIDTKSSTFRRNFNFQIQIT